MLRAEETIRWRSDLSGRLLRYVHAQVAHQRDKIHLDKGHRASETLLEAEEIYLGISVISLPKKVKDNDRLLEVRCELVGRTYMGL
jgi:hypothetical protein